MQSLYSALEDEIEKKEENGKKLPNSFKSDLKHYSQKLQNIRDYDEALKKELATSNVMRSRVKSVISISAAQEFDRFIKELKS